jgi:hypothetical protein
MIIRILFRGSKIAFIAADNRRRFTVDGSRPTFLNFN